jgi:hypothetical protein
MADIFEMHSKAFNSVSAFVIAKDGERIATIALKFPKDGAGRLFAYVHFLGAPMTRGYASGYGYDKRSAAVANAAQKLVFAKSPATAPLGEQEAFDAFRTAIETDGGEYWDTRLRNAGFDVWQAV